MGKVGEVGVLIDAEGLDGGLDADSVTQLLDRAGELLYGRLRIGSGQAEGRAMSWKRSGVRYVSYLGQPVSLPGTVPL